MGYLSTVLGEEISLPRVMTLVAKEYNIEQYKEEDNDFEATIRIVAIKLDNTNTRFAFVRKDGKRIIPLEFFTRKVGGIGWKFAYAYYDFDNDKIVYEEENKTSSGRCDVESLMKSNKEFSKLVNDFISTINPNHK